jgi:hypothetical protein
VEGCVAPVVDYDYEARPMEDAAVMGVVGMLLAVAIATSRTRVCMGLDQQVGEYGGVV